MRSPICDTVAITVNPVNDAPVNTVPGAQVVNEDTALALGGISVNDVDGNLSTVQLGVAQGTVTVNLAGGATSAAARTARRPSRSPAPRPRSTRPWGRFPIKARSTTTGRIRSR